jgi:2-succinyl-6-hydroxy-2,4-cyclohexadiene-1-carboxylate synthase
MRFVGGSERVLGRGAQSLVMLHGFGGTRRAWDQVVAHLPGERYRPLPLDLPGHGEQVDAPRPITFDGCVHSVLQRSPERFVLAGYSMGGRIALHVALAAPARIERLVLISATPGILGDAERAARREADRRLAEAIEGGSIEDFSERWSAQPMFLEDPPRTDRLARVDQSSNRPDGLAAALRGVGTGEMDPLWPRLGELQMPVTLLAGARDGKFAEIGERMASALPDARLLVVQAGHRLLFESPRVVAEALS